MITIRDDKKEKWQSFEARFEFEMIEITGYGKNESEAREDLRRKLHTFNISFNQAILEAGC